MTKLASLDHIWARYRGNSSLRWRNTWQSTQKSTWLNTWKSMWKSAWWLVAWNTHGPPCSACWRLWTGFQRRCCDVQSVGHTGGSGDLLTNCLWLLFACEYLWYIVLHLCNTQIPGEYRINCISLFYVFLSIRIFVANTTALLDVAHDINIGTTGSATAQTGANYPDLQHCRDAWSESQLTHLKSRQSGQASQTCSVLDKIFYRRQLGGFMRKTMVELKVCWGGVQHVSI